MSFNEFIEMGGHGFYVWTCYLVTLFIFVGLFVAVHLQNRKMLQQLRRRYKREAIKASQTSNETADTGATD